MTKLKADFALSKSIKRKWLQALRSGEFKQGTDRLLTVDGTYCCLGVLCRVIGVPDDEIEDNSLPEDCTDEVPSDVEWQVQYKGRLTGLARLNDHDRLSFKKIANIIERTVDTY